MYLYKFCKLCIKEAGTDEYFMKNSEFSINNKKLLFELLDRKLIAFDKGNCVWRITYQTKFKAKYLLSTNEYSMLGGFLIFIFTFIQFLYLFKIR